MSKNSSRPYESKLRQEQADLTRTRITTAARQLFLTQGFDATTIEVIARSAQVSSQTVYAIFRSKQGILDEIISRASFGPAYSQLVKQALAMDDPVERLRIAARIACKIFTAEREELELLRGAGLVAREFAERERKLECGRYEAQRSTIEILDRSGLMKSGMSIDRARDIFWSLTCRDLYRMLVVERGWPTQQYEDWLGELLIGALVEPSARASPSK